jgi:hypothetical protein
MEDLRGACQKRNEQGLVSCGCQEFVSGGRDGQNNWCGCCEHHINMHLRMSNDIVKFSCMSDTDYSLEIILDWYMVHALRIKISQSRTLTQ